MNCNKDRNKANCTCTYEPCPRKGICCECIAFHRKAGEAPGCLFPPEVEKTYDRSLHRLAQCYKK